MDRRLKTERLLTRRLLALAALALAGVLLPVFSSGPADAATTFTVNRTGDAPDRKISDTVCDTSRKKGKQCTLRAAIEEANDTPGADSIRFNIGGDALVKTISPASPLPDITEAVTINGYTQPGASANTLATGNDAVLKIELNGTNAGGRFTNGIKITTSRSIIKGLVINRFFDNGVEIEGSGAAGNRIEGNFIGTNAAGSEALGNGIDGVNISRALNNTVGGIQPAQRNVISGNGDEGVSIGSFGATGNKVLGNFIGTNAAGSEALGNSGAGVFIQSADNTVGGATSGARNVISGNGNRGITIFGAAGNKVEGNRIGTRADGSGGLGNDGEGVLISFGTLDNTMAGTTSGEGNAISGNTGDSIETNSFTATGNSVLSNSIFSNTGLGIDLGSDVGPDGVTANDTDDPDTGANNLQNFPVITSVVQSPSFLNPTTIRGTLNSTPSQEFTVQCFLAGEIPEEADPSGHGEGRAFMAEDIDVRTDASGDASFECDFLFPVSLVGKSWSATATNEATGDTSEFSLNRTVVSGP